MSIEQFVCPEIRFKFWNGKKTYTVEICPRLRVWYVFDEETHDNCLFKYEMGKKEKTSFDLEYARRVLNSYFDSIESPFYATSW